MKIYLQKNSIHLAQKILHNCLSKLEIEVKEIFDLANATKESSCATGRAC